MSSCPRLALLRDGEFLHRLDIPEAGLVVGRDAACDLVLTDASVSRNHLRLWWFDGVLWGRDLGSRNGTLLGAEVLEGACPLSEGDELLVGGSALLRIEGVPAIEESGQGGLWVLDDLHSGVRSRIPRTDAEALWPWVKQAGWRIRVREDGPWLDGSRVAPRLLGDGEEVAFGDRRFVVRWVVPAAEETSGVDADGWPYELRADLQGPGGPVATVDPLRGSGSATTITAETRATLLWVLGRQLFEDREQGRRSTDQGWVDDYEAVRAVWGRRGLQMDVNSLHELVYRLRRDLKAVGLDASCLEKRPGALRIFVNRVELA